MTLTCLNPFPGYYLETFSIIIAATSLIIAFYALYIAKISTTNQIVNFIISSLTHQTDFVESYVNELLAERTKEYMEKAKGVDSRNRMLIESNQWSFILTPLVKAFELYDMHKEEYAKKLRKKHFRLILKTFYVQVPQLVKIRIFEEELVEEFNKIRNLHVKEIMQSQLKTAKDFLNYAKNYNEL